MPNYPTYTVRTHPAPDGNRYQAAVIERETGREVHRTAWHDDEDRAKDTAADLIHEERPVQNRP